MIDHRHLLGLFLAYLGFVVYGSLIPFDFQPLTWDAAVERFDRIPWLRLGAVSRADWVANLVLYVPLAFLGCSAVAGLARRPVGRLVLTVLVILACLGIAVAVEFTQLFFAPRTVSLNDLLAETLGTLAGAFLWHGTRNRIARLGRAFARGGRQSVTASIAIYVTLYVALALFPFDFVISLQELSDKWHSGQVGWLLAADGSQWLRSAASLVGELMAIAPLGLLTALLAGRMDLRRTLFLGLAFGLAMEFVQLFVWSSVSQGASVLARGLGLAAGAFVGQRLRMHGLIPLARWIRHLALPALPVYLIGLAAIAGWFSSPLLGADAAMARFDAVQLLPFYFHYFTSEPVAMASLLANLALYAPIGIYVWATHVLIPRGRRLGIWKAALSALPVVLLMEFSKLWLAGEHADFTNLLIGAAGAMSSYALANWLARVSGHLSAEAADSGRAPAPQTPFIPPPVRRPRPAPGPALVSILAVCGVVAGVWFHPLAIPVIALVLVYAYAIWRSPGAWLLWLPIALPVLDLAPYTGRLLVDEFDLLVLATLAVGYWRSMSAPPAPWAGPGFREATALLLVSGLLATGIGLGPLLDGATMTLDSSHSALEALLVGKGLLWVLLLIPLLRRMPAGLAGQARQWLVAGLAAGLFLLSLVVAGERHRFVGIGDFDSIFRVTGSFSSMNNGGAYIEAFIAISFPALVVWTLHQNTLLLRLCGVAAAALASYAMFVTFSRAGYVGLAVGLVIVAGAMVRRAAARGSRHRGLWLAGVVAVVVAAATPVLLGSFAPGRLAQTEKDLTARLEHWQHALGLMDPGVLPVLTGMGFGRYPAQYLWRADADPPPGTFAVRQDANGAYLRLGAGHTHYLDQILSIDPKLPHEIGVRVRFHGGQNALAVFLCEKALLYSFRCNRHLLTGQESVGPGQWQRLSVPLDATALGDAGRWPRPTLKLSIATPSDGAIDIDLISLRDSRSVEQLANGDFVAGLTHWLPATDHKLAWHIDQSLLEVYFAQGLLGLAAVGAALLAAARALQPGLRRGAPFAVAIGAGLAGFLTVGLLGSTMDAARTAFLFYLLVVAAGALSPAPFAREAHARRPEARARRGAAPVTG